MNTINFDREELKEINMTLISANDAFTNPNNPWYYVIGAAFLVLIIAALVIYITVSKKKNAKHGEKFADAEKISDTKAPDENSEEQESVEQNHTAEMTDSQPENKETDDAEEKAEESENTDKTEKVEEAERVEKAEKDEEPQQPIIEEKAEEVEKLEEQPSKAAATEELPKEEEKAEKPAAKTESATKKKTTTAKKTQKPFIDRLIAEKTVHAVYNELKNTILSYPGMKAKLGKDGEMFVFAAESKAELSLDGKVIVLKLAVDPDVVPQQYGAETADGELKTKLAVSESKIDDAQKLIMFAMNTSMLTRNDRHRRVDYVQNAINAKNRAKSQSSSKSKK